MKKKKDQFDQPQTSDVIEPYARGSPQCQKLDTALVAMVTLDIQPLSVVEDTGFRKFVQALDPRYLPPSRRTMTRSLLPDVYESVRSVLSEELASVQYVALTSDLWTSRQTLGYITVTCHYIDSAWNLKSAVLATNNLVENHTASNIADELKRVTDNWHISDKVVAVTTDNGANIVAAIQLNGWKQVFCYAHTLNLIVQHSLTADAVVSNI